MRRWMSSAVSKGLRAKMELSGPITLAEYMREVLTRPQAGYYMNKDVFGQKGDFITSPEISQLFGELIGVWTLSEWHKFNLPRPFQLVELGPGRGTMMQDILRVYRKLGATEESGVSVHLVEISPHLSEAQASLLCLGDTIKQGGGEEGGHYRSGLTKEGVPVFWYSSVDSIPRSFSCVLAHEFFDALPIHKFVRRKEGWREVLVDLDPAHPERFRFVISRRHTPASALLTNVSDLREGCEVCVEGGSLMEGLASRLSEDGGFMLVADYGHTGEKHDTFRGFRNHKVVDPLGEVGSGDLTADVDFSYLSKSAEPGLVSVGPVSQAHFLHSLHITTRLQVLLENCSSDKEKEDLKSGYAMLTDPDKMGERFKFMAFFPAVLKDHLDKIPIAGFTN